ncbi:signal peptidase I [Peribacillus sp. B-H-3]|uniref:signal peptidase I n=1 Tax=Peribacillus sp. B-H-3 TaxID=3400420 RepID=UPI003B01AF4B
MSFLKKSPVFDEVLSWIKSALIALIIVVICRTYIFTPTLVKGESMMPNLQDGNCLIISKIGEPKRFDEVVFHATDSKDDYIKRVIGLPGDTVEMKNDTLYVNGIVYKEPYLNLGKKKLPFKEKYTGDFTLKEITGRTKVPKDSLFVLGDNRPISNDSRIFGFIPQKSVIGKVKLQVWPLSEIGIPK